MPRALITLVLIATLLAAGCTLTRDNDPPEPDAVAGAARWEPCPEVPEQVLAPLDLPASAVRALTRGLTYECATIAVPRDWADPDGATFDVALLRARHEDQRDRIGSLVINPGGPGGSGVDRAVYLSFGSRFGGVPAEVMQRFDLVGFDPRGVKRSSPVKCFSDADLDRSVGTDPDPVSDQAFAEVVAETRRMAEECGKEYGDTLDYYSTEQTARDLEAVRVAVGDERLTYLGLSYGTRLGAVYAHLFPERVRAMVLDGAVDPAEERLAAARGQAEGFERALDAFTRWCTQTPRQCPLEPDARSAIMAAMEQARRSPAMGDDGREATAGWVQTAVVAGLYSDDTWPVLAAAIDQLDGGDPTGVFDLADAYSERSADGAYSNLFDANTAISCADNDAEISLEQVRDLQARWREEFPFLGASIAVGLIGCQLWPAEPDPHPVGPADGAPPILVVGTTGDPATPYESATALAKLLGVGVVLTYQGEGHTAYPRSDCVNRIVDAYLIELTVPEDGTVCD